MQVVSDNLQPQVNHAFKPLILCSSPVYMAASERDAEPPAGWPH